MIINLISREGNKLLLYCFFFVSDSKETNYSRANFSQSLWETMYQIVVAMCLTDYPFKKYIAYLLISCLDQFSNVDCRLFLLIIFK